MGRPMIIKYLNDFEAPSTIMKNDKLFVLNKKYPHYYLYTHYGEVELNECFTIWDLIKLQEKSK